MEGISYLDQGVNPLLLGEVFGFLFLFSVLCCLYYEPYPALPTINASEKAESWNLVLDFCLKSQLFTCYLLILKDKLSEPLWVHDLKLQCYSPHRPLWSFLAER